jgi:hypothetical protein
MSGSVVSFLPALYTATKSGEILDDISAYLMSGEVDLDLDRTEGSKMVFTGKMRNSPDLEPLDLPAMRSYVAPFLRLIYEDGSETMEQQGLFVVIPARAEHHPSASFYSLEGRDLCWLLAANQTPITVTDSPGTSPVSLAHTALSSVGMPRRNIPATTYTNPKAITWPIGTSRLKRINARLESAGYYSLWFDRKGVATSRAYDDLATKQAAVTYSSATGSRIVPPVTDEPDWTRVCNRVIVIGSDASIAPIAAIRENNDPLSSMAFQNNDNNWITRFVESADIKEQAAANAMADQMIQQGATYYRRLTIETLPDPERNPREIYELDIHGEQGEIATGKWFCSGYKLSLDWKAPTMRHEVNRIEEFTATAV